MSRPVNSSTAAALAERVVPLAALGEFEFPGGTVRFTTAPVELSWDDKTWSAVGTLGGIGAIEETAEVSPREVVVTLSGIPSEALALAMGDRYRGRPARIWMAAMNAAMTAVVGEPIPIAAGRMDRMSIVEDAQDAVIELSIESRLVDMTRARMSRYTHAEQQRRFPGDRGLEFIAKSAERPLYWGVPSAAAQAAPGRGPSGPAQARLP